MGRLLAQMAKLVGRGHEPAAEVLLPDAVDNHPGREGILWADDPPCECRAAACALQRRRWRHDVSWFRVEQRQNAGGDRRFCWIVWDVSNRRYRADVANDKGLGR